jgi:hypothetical protein
VTLLERERVVSGFFKLSLAFGALCNFHILFLEEFLKMLYQLHFKDENTEVPRG